MTRDCRQDKEEVARMSWQRAWTMALLLVLAPVVSWAQAPRIASTDWLAQHLTDENQTIVDVRDDIKAYWAGHVPGAVWLSPEALRWPDSGVPGKLMPCDQMAKLVSLMGVTSDGTVLIYAEESNFKPAYLAWALDYLGHKNWAIVDGGYRKWTAEKRAVSQAYPNTVSCPCFSYPGPVAFVRSRTADVLARKGDTMLLDVRVKKAYTGEEGPWLRKGHIPGAISHPWSDDITADGVWKSKAELQAAYLAQGIIPDKLIIASCGQGQMSAHTYVTLKYVLGYPNVTNYDGGFNEWSNSAALPVNTGETP